MSATIITIVNALARFATGETEPVDWLTEEDFSCQVQTASVDATPNLQDVDATWCQPATQVPGATSYTVNLAGLQDWTVATGLSMFLFDNDAQPGWVQLTLPDTEPGTPQASCVAKVRFVAGSFGGAAGTPLTFTAAFPVQGKPTIEQATAAVMAAEVPA